MSILPILPTFISPQCWQDVLRKSSLGLRRHEARKIFAQGDFRCSISLVLQRGFHNSLILLAESKSDKPSTYRRVDEICDKVKKKNEPCKKPDLCRQEKVKCRSEQQKQKPKPKIEKIEKDPMCAKTCLSRGKCELPRTVPPPKMEYAKVTCPPPKYVKPDPCPPMLEHHEENGPHIEARQVTSKKAICTPPPLPKPPCGPILLCPCPPPRKVHPGPCPCYEHKGVVNTRPVQPCPLKKKYPCPDVVHICPMEKKPCILKRGTCEHRKRKETPES